MARGRPSTLANQEKGKDYSKFSAKKDCSPGRVSTQKGEEKRSTLKSDGRRAGGGMFNVSH